MAESCEGFGPALSCFVKLGRITLGFAEGADGALQSVCEVVPPVDGCVTDMYSVFSECCGCLQGWST